MNLQAFWEDSQKRVNHTLENHLPQNNNLLSEAMHYAVFNGGKRLRPMLVYAIQESFSNNNDNHNFNLIAAALECMHSYSLVHDDLPAMDDDDLRRGNPSCHIQFDEATAILCGDALQCFAFELLTSLKLSADKAIAIIQILCQSSGADGMALGQHYDLIGRADNTDELEELHVLKTGKLISAAVLMAYQATENVNEKTQTQLKNYAYHLGLAFQICDDILDCTSSSEVLGKPANSDIRNEKITYVSFYGLEKSKALMCEEVEKAIITIENLDLSEKRLIDIAQFFIERIS